MSVGGDSSIDPAEIAFRGSAELPLLGEDQMRHKLKYFFMNPCEKWKMKRKFPWKLVLQLVKVVLVTIQLAMFGFTRSAHVDFLEKSNVAFHHLFLKNWSAAFETLPYPPATGPFAVYTIPAFYDSVNNALDMYNKTEAIAIGTYHLDSSDNETAKPVWMCVTKYRVGRIWQNQSFIFNSKQITECFPLEPVPKYNSESDSYEEVFDVEEYLKQINKSLNFDSLIKVRLLIGLSTVHLKSLSKMDRPDCYQFNITIIYDNREHSGQMVISLESSAISIECHGHIMYDSDDDAMVTFASIFDAVVTVVSLGSLLLCVRSIYRAQKLKALTVHFFQDNLGKTLCWNDRLEFLNMWYVLIIVNDVLTIAGSASKIEIQIKASHDYEVCGVLLGTGNLLVWFGVLRYLGFFEKYNILILTMKKSAPSVLRFLVCAGVFYFGFTICGWVVLGPYHLKFRTLTTTSECLFSLVNGDDMFATFQGILRKLNPALWLFSRIYLYSFISLFIYMVLNLFIAVIMDSYEVIKFRQISTASECLFSLINGDDMFNTFAMIANADSYAWWYSRIYLYCFISFFVYMVLSVFISVIMGTYETIKHYHEHGFPQSELDEFIHTTSSGGDPMMQAANSAHPQYQDCFCSCFACFRKDTAHEENREDGLAEPGHTSSLSLLT